MQDLEDEGSPVYVAKSYMRARPPWASPSIDQISPQTSIAIQFFNEETPYLFSRNSIMSPKVPVDMTFLFLKILYISFGFCFINSSTAI